MVNGYSRQIQERIGVAAAGTGNRSLQVIKMIGIYDCFGYGAGYGGVGNLAEAPDIKRMFILQGMQDFL